ncbi:Fic family protein [Bacillus toyonensis]|uniref:Fic family protein n=1 Tax=Bacillus toyonensis TaxID=155322 RepID=UPI000BEB49E1|nr:Fic family protein [Bacillus toyonensis]PEE26458.1 cell filamentation protein Fic [Bacillus toyonensis]PHG29035.1 cell filamentation protein Fic [Bacillus toyonensis]
MRNFFEEKYTNLEFKRELINIISKISEYKGAISAYQTQKPEIFDLLEKSISLQYIKTFPNIYDKLTFSNKQLKKFVSNRVSPQTLEEDALFCYYKTLELVQKENHKLPIKPQTIQELHFQLLNYSTSESGNWRKNELVLSCIPMLNNQSKLRTVVLYDMVPQYLYQLCEQYNTLRAKGNFHPLLLIPQFILNFLCIYPFNKGNGKLAKILIQWLLIESGYTFVKYTCIEKYFKKYESDYYDALYKSAANWHQGDHNVVFWMKIFLDIVLGAYEELNNLINNCISTHTKRKRIEKYIDKQNHPFTKENIRNMHPDISESTINKTLHALNSQGYIKLVSKGRNAEWIKSKLT